MTTNEEIAVVGVALAAATLGFIVWQHHHLTAPAAPRQTVAAAPVRGGSGIGNAIASVGGAAVAQLGKATAGYVTDEIASLFG